MKNLIIVILTFGVVALAGYTYKLQKTIQTQETLPSNADKPVVVEVAPKPEPPPPVTPPPVVENNENEFVDPDSFSDTSKEEAALNQLKKANELIAALHEANQELEEETEPDIFKGIKQIMESPEIKGMIEQGMTRDMKRRNASLFRWLNLDPAQEDQVMQLMIENGMQEMGRGIQWMTGNIEGANEDMLASRASMHAELEQLIGPEKLEIYKYFEDSRNEREAVSRFNRQLGENKLSDEASDELVGMMYDTRAEYPDLDNLSRPENFNPRDMTPERREDVMGQVEQLHGQYVENARPMLSDDQLSSYEQSLSNQRRQLNGFMEFTHGMMNRRDQAASNQE